ncbi:hypothetical protein Tco_0373119 [Tanacetum coccineum]
MNNMETIMETGMGMEMVMETIMETGLERHGNGKEKWKPMEVTHGDRNERTTMYEWKGDSRTYKTTRNAVRIANNLMDQKFEGLCSEEMQITREIEQHTMETTRGQQPPQQTTEFWRT